MKTSFLAAVGVSYRETPIELRERLSALPAELPAVLRRVLAVEGAEEAVVLSTCNRVELYVALACPGGPSDRKPDSSDRAVKRRLLRTSLVTEEAQDSQDDEQQAGHPSCPSCPSLLKTSSALCEAGGVRLEEIEPSLYRLCGLDAVRHLFEVASGLDSMVPGENEILAQVKTAYRSAADAGAAGPRLSRLFQRTLKVAKDVRSRTGISKRRLSIATVVTDLAKKVFGRLEGTSAALVGAGEMAELTLKALVSEKAEVAFVANRSIESAKRLARTYGSAPRGDGAEADGAGSLTEAVTLDEVGVRMQGIDVLVASTSAPRAIITAEQVKEATRPRRGRPVLLVDLGVPRNIEPDAGELSGVILYNLDDLEGIVATNKAYRLSAAGEARVLVEEEVAKFAALLRTEQVSGTIAELSAAYRRICEAETGRAIARLGDLGDLTDEQREEVGRMAQRIAGKVLHLPIAAIKEEARSGNGAEIAAAARRLFGLGPRSAPPGPVDAAGEGPPSDSTPG